MSASATDGAVGRYDGGGHTPPRQTALPLMTGAARRPSQPRTPASVCARRRYLWSSRPHRVFHGRALRGGERVVLVGDNPSTVLLAQPERKSQAVLRVLGELLPRSAA